ncbi:MAG: PEGA domain-containing protein [Planctomycetota bacterium]
MFRASVRLAAPLLLVAATSCRFPTHQPGVRISSEPAGAMVFVDGSFSGQVTPAYLGISLDEWHQVRVEKPGYGTQWRVLSPGGRWHFVDWRLGRTFDHAYWFPLFLPWPEAVIPLSYESRLEPKRVHFYLRRVTR